MMRTPVFKTKTFEEYLKNQHNGADGFIKGLRHHAWKLMGWGALEGRNYEDVVQSALLKGFVHFEQYNPKYQFSTWMYRIVENIIYTMFRDYSRHIRLLNPVWANGITVDGGDGEPKEIEFEIPTTNPENTYMAKFDVYPALSNMTPKQRRMLRLFFENERRASDLEYKEKQRQSAWDNYYLKRIKA